jgi:hypothetical protein
MKTWIASLAFVAAASSLPALADDYAAKADQAIAETKPTGMDSAATASLKCQKLSDEARARGARVLVIGFEGLASFSATATQQLYRYEWELNHRVTATAPARPAFGGFVVTGTLLPVAAKLAGAVEMLAYPYTAQSDAAGSVPETCALEWMKVPNRHLVVIGHSFGGDAADQLMKQLEARSVPVDFVITEDPVPKTPRPVSVLQVTRNARRWENYYQRAGLPMGASLGGAAVNEQVRAGHIGVPYVPNIVQSALAHVGALAGMD